MYVQFRRRQRIIICVEPLGPSPRLPPVIYPKTRCSIQCFSSTAKTSKSTTRALYPIPFSFVPKNRHATFYSFLPNPLIQSMLPLLPSPPLPLRDARKLDRLVDDEACDELLTGWLLWEDATLPPRLLERGEEERYSKMRASDMSDVVKLLEEGDLW